MKVLVTGGTGTISSSIVKKCAQRGMDVYAITRGNRKYRNIENVTYITADLWNKAEVATALEGLRFDVVVECLVYNVEQLKISLANFGGVCDQYVFISTSGVYRRNSENIRISETIEKNNDEWGYTRNKIACEEYLKQHCSEYSFTYTIVRPVVTYGSYRIPFPVATRNPSWTFFQRMLDNKPILTCENVQFSVLHSDDFSEAVVGLFLNQMSENEDFHIADVSGDIYWDDVVTEAARLLNVKPLVIHVPAEAFKLLFREIYDEIKWDKSTSMLMDDGKLKKAVPTFQQRIPLKEGIKRIMNEMYTEKEEQSLALDTRWNLKCDMLIYYAYRKKLLAEKEQQMLKIYYKSVPHSEIKKIGRSMHRTMIKEKIKSIEVLRTVYKKLSRSNIRG